MELLRHKCKGLLVAERDDFTRQLNDLKNEARGREKKVRSCKNILHIKMSAKFGPSNNSNFSCPILLLSKKKVPSVSVYPLSS